jgi:hypothetical protein
MTKHVMQQAPLTCTPGKGGLNDDVPFQLLSQRLQSLPAVPGQGMHVPPTSPFSHGWQAKGVELVSLGPGRHRGPSASVGMGIIDHMDLPEWRGSEHAHARTHTRREGLRDQ